MIFARVLKKDYFERVVECSPTKLHLVAYCEETKSLCLINYDLPESVTIAPSMVSPGVLRKKSGG